MPSETNIQPAVFQFASQSLRVIMIDDAPWFVAADVCAALDLPNTTRTIERLDDDEQSQVIDPSTLNINQGTGINNLLNIINESGLYSLILTSRKPEAKKFKKWVTSEVLPAIRKTGQYIAPRSDQDHGKARKAYDGVEHITSRQFGELQQIVRMIESHVHCSGGANHAAYSAIRQTFGVESTTKLPSERFDEAYDLLKHIESTVFGFKCRVMEIEKRLFRRVIRGGNPHETAALEAALDHEMTSVLALHTNMLEQLR